MSKRCKKSNHYELKNVVGLNDSEPTLIITVKPQFANMTKLEFSRKYPDAWNDMQIEAFQMLMENMSSAVDEAEVKTVFQYSDAFINKDDESFDFAHLENDQSFDFAHLENDEFFEENRGVDKQGLGEQGLEEKRGVEEQGLEEEGLEEKHPKMGRDIDE